MQEVNFFSILSLSSYKELHFTAFIFTQELGPCVVPKLRYENVNYTTNVHAPCIKY